MGRPSLFTQELASKILEGIAEGESMRTICAAPGMPSLATIFNWLQSNPAFLEQYTRAKDMQADAFTEDMVAIADDETLDANSRRIRVDTRKWIASKLKPKKYGDSVQLKHADAEGNVMQVRVSGIRPTDENT